MKPMLICSIKECNDDLCKYKDLKDFENIFGMRLEVCPKVPRNTMYVVSDKYQESGNTRFIQRVIIK
jgi:hypothetical protein